MIHLVCDIVYAGKELKRGSSRKIAVFSLLLRFGGLLRLKSLIALKQVNSSLFHYMINKTAKRERRNETMRNNNPRSANGNLRRKHRARLKAIGGECGICKGRLGPIHYNEPSDSKHPLSFVIDEIKPVSRWREFGYSSREAAAQDWNNLQPAHYCCNAAKSNKTLNEMQRSQQKPKMNVTDGDW